MLHSAKSWADHILKAKGLIEINQWWMEKPQEIPRLHPDFMREMVHDFSKWLVLMVAQEYQG